MRINIIDIEIDWQLSLEIIMKKFTKSDVSWNNNEYVAFNIKNYLEILPTMSLLNKRNPEIYQRSICVRCNSTVENWIHIWICNKNSVTMVQIINDAYNRLKERLEQSDNKVDHTRLHAYLFSILNDRSLMIFN